MSPIVESNIYALGVAKQAVAGTPTAAPVKRLIQVAGDFQSPQDIGSENYSDLGQWGTSTDWINSVQGNGNPGCEADTDTLAYLLWLFNGAEVVTVNAEEAGLNDHTTTPAVGNGFLSTWHRRVGSSLIRRDRYGDCLMSQMQIEGSTANKAVRVTPSIISLDPANHATADPTWPTLPPSDTVLIYTEAEGTFEIDDVIIRGHSQFTVVMNKDLQVVYTDSIVPYEVRRGTPVVSVACTIQADAAGLAQFNKLLYGTASPTAGQKPQPRVPAIGSYNFAMEKRDPVTDDLTGGYSFDMRGVRWTLPEFPGANPDGGDATLAMSGVGRINASNPMYTHVVTNDKVAYTT